MEVRSIDDGTRGRFEIDSDEGVAAVMTYVWAGGDKMIIDHTQVSESLRGRGAGKLLVMEAVAFARDKEVKIVPLCPFAKSVFDRNPQIRDVLAAG